MLACEDKTELERQAQAWCDSLALFGLKLNVKKTEYLTRHVDEHGSLKINGLDYAGPLLCKTDNNPSAKYWTILLLSCLNTRAIYADLVLNMTASAPLYVLRRFFATKACPKWILCDNSKTFKSIADLHISLDAERDQNPDIIDYCARRRIDFKLTPASARGKTANVRVRGEFYPSLSATMDSPVPAKIRGKRMEAKDDCERPNRWME
ncbi:unnamed protein product [Heligmosomoides polygyrus]|uniref:Integrase catalytic domain-containing protein n=1 Tax=Heligmosomoides polygyrus TaxID=6339 RepID=A0A183FKG7_HELPZ|nr:unnamed protein product [Heligmosomoides polygyrus]